MREITPEQWASLQELHHAAYEAVALGTRYARLLTEALERRARALEAMSRCGRKEDERP